MGDQRVRIAEGDRHRAQVAGLQHLFARCDAALELERQHAAETPHLPAGGLVTREGLQPGVVDLSHFRMVLQELRYGQGVFVVAKHAQLERLHPAQDLIGFHGADRRACHVQQGVFADLLDEVRLADHRTGDHVAVAVDVFRHGVDDHVSAERQRVLVVRGREGVVADDPDLFVRAVGDGADRFDVTDVAQRIPRAFQIDHLRVRPDRGLQLLQVGKIDEVGLYAEIRQIVAEQGVAVAVDDRRADDVVTGPQRREQAGCHRRHAGTRNDAAFAALQKCQFFFQHRLGGVAAPGVGVAGRAPEKYGFGFVDAVEFVGDRRNDGGAHGTVEVAAVARVDRLRSESHIFCYFHRCLLIVFCYYNTKANKKLPVRRPGA